MNGLVWRGFCDLGRKRKTEGLTSAKDLSKSEASRRASEDQFLEDMQRNHDDDVANKGAEANAGAVSGALQIVDAPQLT
jgi:hypothetical protein